MATNNFKPFATASGANVVSQSDYEQLQSLATGFQSGKASSAQINKALRQSTTMAAVLAQFIADKSGKDVLDDGTVATLVTNLLAALKANNAEGFLQTANSFLEIKNAGPAAVAAALGNLGLGDKFSGRFMGRRIFTAPGNITYQPSSGTRKIKIILTGGGGHGYGFLGWGENYRSRGAGGGAGATAIAWLDVDDSKTYAGIVGRGADDTLGATSSTFNGVLTAANGLNSQTGDAGGAGGLAVGGDLNIQGGDGSDAPGIVGAANPYCGGSGDGGVSYWGGGQRSGESSNNGRKSNYGSGGGGNTRVDPYVGNYGSHGVIYIEEYS